MKLVRTLVAALAAVTLVDGSACGNSSSPSTQHDAGGTATDASPKADAARDASGGGTADANTAAEASADAAGEAGADGGILAARPYTMHVPTGYAAATPTPLVVMFHGYGASGGGEELYFQMTATSDKDTFLYAYGNGTIDTSNSRFWNATDACCDLYGAPVDDVAYFDAIVADARARYNVDPKRIYVIGHSNGGFMSHRLACDRADTVAAILSLAGAVWNDATRCAPTAHVSVAEVHGDADMTIVYTGGSTPEGTYPAATTTVSTWAAKNGCGTTLAPTGVTLDLDTTLPGNETTVQGYSGCPAGIDVQLWTIHGGAHIPTIPYPGWGDAVWSFLSTHPKP
jgi:polyhydroxybutyrate depolymerase